MSPTDGTIVGNKILLWVMVSKLVGIVHKDGSIEDEESSKDYISLHVYYSKTEAAKIKYESEPYLKRSSYSPEQTMKLSIELDTKEYLNTGKALNLVLD